MPNNAGPMLLITDVALSPTGATDDQWTPLGSGELRDLMAAALASTAGPVADGTLRLVFSGEKPQRTILEFTCGRRRANQRIGRARSPT